MGMYVVTCILIMGTGIIMQILMIHPKHVYYKKIYFGIITVFLIFTFGLRSFSVGIDTQSYVTIFENMGMMSYKTILATRPYGFELGYALFAWLIYQIISNGHVFIMILSIICFSSIGIWIYRNSVSPVTSYLIFFSIFFTFQLTGIRQSMALAILFFAFEKLKKKQFIPFVIVVLLASTFHYSAIIFLLAYFVFDTKIRWVKIVSLYILIPIIYYFREDIFIFIRDISGYVNYKILDHGDPILYTILIFMITAVSILFRKKILQNNPNAVRYINAMMITCLIMPFVGLNGSILRVAMYFSVYLIFLIPEIINCFEDKLMQFVIKYVMVILLLFLFLRNMYLSTSYQFSFLWQ